MKRFVLIMGCVVWTIFLLSCREDPLPIRDNLKVTAEIRLKTLLNFKEVRDGYVVSGIKDSKLTISKLDMNFNVVWTQNSFEWGNIYSEGGWGGSFYSIDRVEIIEKENGDLVCFCSIMQGGDVIWHSVRIVRLDQSGNERRSKEIAHYALISVTPLGESDYLLFGNSFIRLASDFTIVSENKELNYVMTGAYLTPTADQGVAVTGTWNSQQVYLQKLDQNGNIQWEKKNYNQTPFNDLGYDLRQMANGDFVIIGRTRNLKEPWDIDCFMIRTNPTGDTIWTKKFGSDANEWLEKLIYTSANNFIIQQTIGFPNQPDRSARLLRISGNGEIVDSKAMNISDQLIYTTAGYFVKAAQKGDNILSLTKIPFDNLFD